MITTNNKKLLKLGMISAIAATVTACSSIPKPQMSIGADAMGRSIPERISDSSIELTARRNLATIPGINENNVRIAIDSYRRDVLLTGEVPSESVKMEVGRTIESMRDVDKVFNYMTVTETPKSQSHTVQENYLRSKINARLLANRDIKSSQYKVVVRDRTAYVMGYMTPAQQEYVLNAIQATPGMEMAVTLTSLVGDAEAHISTELGTNAISESGEVYNDINNGYALQEVYTPNAGTTAPINAAPVMGGQ